LKKWDVSHFKPLRFEFAPKPAALRVRLPKALLPGLKA
jgi:predicted DNA binding CopG/RHH family protein